MGRKSLAPERRTAILDAFQRAVKKYGLDAASLDKIGDECGLGRRMVLHYFKSRDQLEQAAVSRIFKCGDENFTKQVDGLPAKDRLPGLLDWMFFGGFTDPELDPLFRDLLARANRCQSTRQMMHLSYLGIQKRVGAEIGAQYPEIPEARREDIASHILALCFTCVDLRMMGFPEQQMRSARRAADALIGAAVEGIF